MKKINIAELLKDCPQGMELDCTMFDNVTFDRVADNGIWIEHNNSMNRKHYSFLRNDGSFPIPNLHSLSTKCIIFPKGKTTWEGFYRPLKDGDIIYNRLQKRICIYYLVEDGVHRIKDCRYNESNTQFEKLDYPIPITVQDYRLATKQEKEKLFEAIKANGYRWNFQTNRLEKLIKPIFKKGDKVRVKKGFPEPRIARIIEDVGDTFYTLVSFGKIDFTDQDNWELVPDKFDIKALKPFTEVLVRNSDKGRWVGQFYLVYDPREEYPFECTYNCWKQCIPYKGNEHLLGKTYTCNYFYKTWEQD